MQLRDSTRGSRSRTYPGTRSSAWWPGPARASRRCRPGRRVTVEPYLPCWHCKQCLRGQENICENLGFLGCGDPQGAMADYFTVDARRIHVVPDELDDRAAALIEPLSTPVHAVRLAGGVAGRTVAVLGAGSIGLLLLRVVVAQGAKRVVITAPRAERRQLGARAGSRRRGRRIRRRCGRPGPQGSGRERGRRLRLRRQRIDDEASDRHGGQGRHGRRRRRPERRGPAATAARAGPADPHPGQRDLPAGGRRRLDRAAAVRRRAARRLHHLGGADGVGRRGLRAGGESGSHQGPARHRRGRHGRESRCCR